MIVFEYFFKEFDARGSGEYLGAWAAGVDRMAEEGWGLVERIPKVGGQWTVLFCRPGQTLQWREADSKR